MKKSLLFLVYCLGCAAGSAQNPLVKQWDKRFGCSQFERLYALKSTIDSGYILGGHSTSDSCGDKATHNHGTGGDWDYWVIKVDKNGNKQWDSDFGCGSTDIFTCIDQTKDKGYIIGGYSFCTLDGDHTQLSRGTEDYWIVRTDSAGHKLWDKRFGGLMEDELNAVECTNDGGFILGGYTRSSPDSVVTTDTVDVSQFSRGGKDYWVVKIDSNGNKQWDTRYGGSGNDILYCLHQTIDGGYILGGSSISDAGFDKSQNTWSGSLDFWVVKVDANGIKQWDKTFGGTGEDELYSLALAMDGGYILAGTSNSPASGNKSQGPAGGGGDVDFWMVKIDQSGNKQWDADFGGTADEDAFGNVFVTDDGGYMVAGTSYSNISGSKTENNLGHEQTWIVKTDMLGNKLWDKTLFTNSNPDDEVGYALQDKYDHSYVFANYTDADTGGYKTQPSRGQSDYWMIKFVDTTLHCNSSVSISVNGNILTAYNAISYQWYLNGNVINGATNNIYVANQPGSYTVAVTDSNGCSATSNAIVITSISEISNQQSTFSISPNPATNQLFIETNGMAVTEINIYNTTGSLVSQTKQPQSKSIDISQLANGVYIAEIKTKGVSVKRRWVKM